MNFEISREGHYRELSQSTAQIAPASGSKITSVYGALGTKTFLQSTEKFALSESWIRYRLQLKFELAVEIVQLNISFDPWLHIRKIL